MSDPAAGEPPAMMVDTALIVDVVKGSEPPPEHKAVLYLTEPQRQPEQ